MPATSPPNTLGNNLCAARQRYNKGEGITQLGLAHAIGWVGNDAGAQIARYEAGKVQPSIDTLQRLANALGVSLESLLSK